ncbi:MAG: T9SS type A sorting domain-containing protein [Flavobacteriales bacterium]|nr:T9SS type A sorting domain-containing protein [Flavobacteriales bacterium]
MPRLLLSQCDGCVPDQSCTASPAFPTLCPATAPDATVGEYYEQDFTFWMPTTFDDPGSGFTVSLLQLTITGVSGLPFGLSFTTNEPSGVYYPPDNEFGCARICGTPFGAGSYTVVIAVLAHVSASGFELDVPQTFSTAINVLPGSGSNTSFTFAPTSGCGSVIASFQALIDGSPSPTSYAWDFGNGNTSALASPPSQVFTVPGTYEITLQTTISAYVLNAVNVTGVNGNWCGDVEEPDLPLIGCTGAPDPYFVLTNASGGTYTSSSATDVSTASWGNLGLLLDNPPYSLSVYDEDVISGNDLLGTYNITLGGAGTFFFNVAGGTTGSINLSIEPQQVFQDTAEVVVFPLPDVVLVQNSITSELCAQDQTLNAYAWVLDGLPVPDETNPCLVPSSPGLWQVIGTNGFGCSDTSNVIVVCPVFNIARNGGVLFVPSGYLSYAWTYNGVPVGGNDPFVFLQGDGTYGVVVDAGNGCIITLTYLHDTTGLGDQESAGSRIEVFPNPSDGRFTLAAEGLQHALVYLDVLDVAGRVVWQETAIAAQGRLRQDIELSLPSGAYMVRLTDGGVRRIVRIVLR